MDWDLDGQLDILSGSYKSDGLMTGHLQILKGNGNSDFAAAITLTNETGSPANNVTVSDATPIPVQLKNLCTHQHAVDYDSDGDLDLVVGSNMDQIYLHENLAESGEPAALSSSPIALPLRLPQGAGHSAPHLADWDNDGDLDLISGSSLGGVFISTNSGSRSQPSYEPFQVLIPLPETATAVSKSPQSQSVDEIQLGKSTRVWATDFNSDGWLDLLIGGKAERPATLANEASSQSKGYVWVVIRKPPE